jgi:DNA-binding CsgD family transcriptional regulator/pimeloyl-ACP methyl ester carboxylesterase
LTRRAKSAPIPLKVNATVSLSESLRGRLAEGQPVDAVLDGWALLDSTLVHDPAAFAEALGEAAKLDSSAGFAAIAPEGSLGAAVISPSGALAQADPQFIRWFGDPTDIPAFRRLARLAQKQGQASGLVETEDGGIIAACAAIETLALRWPLSEASRAQLLLPGRRIALLGFAPSRVSALAVRAAQAFGFTPLEARLAEALLDAPNLAEAAERIGVGRETAREALKKAMRKAGARRSPDLVRRMMDLMSGMGAPIGDVEAVLRALFGATPAEAKAAARFAEGLTAREVAAALGVKEATVRGQLKAVFAKTGVNKAKDLVRLTVEAGALTAFTEASETVVEPIDPEGRPRILSLDSGRRVAFIDYGPKGGRPVVVFHGYSIGRILPLGFVALLHRAGYRPLSVQRPGFGLSDPAPTPESHLAVQADDLLAVLTALKLRKVDVMIRDGSTAAGLAFAARHGDRIGRGLLMNPRPPREVERSHFSLIGAVARTMLKHPELIAPLGEMLRRQTRTDLLTRTIRRSLESAPGDRAAIDDPLIMARILRDARGMSARTSAGWAAEMAVYALGWTLPPVIGGDHWSILFCEGLDWPVHLGLWQDALPSAPITTLPAAGFLAYFTHPAEVIAALEG